MTSDRADAASHLGVAAGLKALLQKGAMHCTVDRFEIELKVQNHCRR